jgi:hypothetical protein
LSTVEHSSIEFAAGLNGNWRTVVPRMSVSSANLEFAHVLSRTVLMQYVYRNTSQATL